MKTKTVRVILPNDKRRGPGKKSLRDSGRDSVNESDEVGEVEEVQLEDEPTDEELEATERLGDFQSRFTGKQYKVRVERFNAEEADWEWVTRLPLEGFDPFNILPKYGGGKYRAVLMDEKGRYVKGGTMEFRFSAPIEPTIPDRPKSALEDPAVMMVIENAKAQSAMLMEIVKASLPAQAAAQNKGMDAMQVMDMFAKFSAMTAPKENGAKSFMEMMTLFEKVKDTFTPEEKESSGIVSEIKEAMGALALLPQIRAAGQAGSGPSVPGPVPGQNPIRPMPRVMSPSTPIEMPGGKSVAKQSVATQKLLFYIPKFEEAARESQPIDKWADRLLDILDDEVIPALVKEYNGFVTEDSIYTRLLEAGKNMDERENIFVHAPILLAYKEWVYGVIDEAIKIVESDTDESDGEPDAQEINGGPHSG